MRRQLLTLTLVGVLGVLLASDARACHKLRCPHKCAPAAPVCCEPTPAPCPAPAPVCCEPAPKKCGLFKHLSGCGHHKIKLGGLCHKKPACEPTPVCCEPAPYAGPVVYATTQVMPSAQVHASGQ
jgi:hypothetical protein